MRILLIGSGGREHALAWRLSQSPSCTKLFAAPGNPGIAECAILLPLGDSDFAEAKATAVEEACHAHRIDLVVVGPEVPLVAGLADRLRAAGIPVFGPSSAAARIEGSKSFTKALCDRAGIPTAAYEVCSDEAAALRALGTFSFPVVVKADGLAAGKGVVIAESQGQAEDAIRAIFRGKGESAAAVIEDYLIGEEVSFFALTDGSHIMAFGSAQDHKRVGEGNTGPNTGGMGAYSPARILTSALESQVMEGIIRPTVEHLTRYGSPYVGVLYAGLMLTATGPRLIEYNCRFGDPECQVLMMRLRGDLAVLLHAVATGTLASAAPPIFDNQVALCVVMAAHGYPVGYEKGGHIGNIKNAERAGAKVFHAGTRMKDGQLTANGGRVLTVTATGETVTQARVMTYRAIDALDFPGGFCRRDIGWREQMREQKF